MKPTLVEGGSGEAAAGRFVAGWLEEHGIETQYEEVQPCRANVVGRVRGNGGGRTLLLNAHLDTVGVAGMNYLIGVEAGVRVLHTAPGPMA